MASLVVLVTPPSVPEAGEGLMKAFMSLESSVMRVLSPNRDPVAQSRREVELMSFFVEKKKKSPWIYTVKAEGGPLKAQYLSCRWQTMQSHWVWKWMEWNTQRLCQSDGWCYLLWCRRTGQPPALTPCVLVTSAFSPPPRWRKTSRLLEDLTALRNSQGDRVSNNDNWPGRKTNKLYNLVLLYIWASFFFFYL